MKYLVIYRIREKNYKYDHFMKNGVYTDDDVEFMFVNDDDYRTKISMDKYDRFVYLDSTVYGPVYPKYVTDRKWVQYYERMRNDMRVNMLGSHPVNRNGGTWINYPFIMTKRGMELVNDTDDAAHRCVTLIQNRYDVGSMSGHLLSDIVKDLSQVNEYSVNPYEVLFTDTTVQDIVQKWDPISYVLTNRDLYRKGIRDTIADDHYKKIGRQERRLIYRDVGTRYMSVSFNCDKNNSLGKQLNCLVTAIILGHYTARNVVLDYMYTDYSDTTKLIPIESIIDIDGLNRRLQENGIRTRVISVTGDDLYSVKLKTNVTNSIVKNFFHTYTPDRYIEYMHELAHEDSEGVHLGTINTDSKWFSKHQVFSTLFSTIVNCIDVTSSVKKIVNGTIDGLELKDHITIQLRLEDDMLEDRCAVNDNDYAQTTVDKYTKLVNLLKNEKVFVMTHLYRKQYTYRYLLSDSPVLTSKDCRKYSTIEYAEGREMDALVDYMISKSSALFIGTNRSRLAEYIHSTPDLNALYLEDIDVHDNYMSCKSGDKLIVYNDTPALLNIDSLEQVEVKDNDTVLNGITSGTITKYKIGTGLHIISVSNEHYDYTVEV